MFVKIFGTLYNTDYIKAITPPSKVPEGYVFSIELDGIMGGNRKYKFKSEQESFSVYNNLTSSVEELFVMVGNLYVNKNNIQIVHKPDKEFKGFTVRIYYNKPFRGSDIIHTFESKDDSEHFFNYLQEQLL